MSKHETYSQAINNINSCLTTANLKELKTDLQLTKNLVNINQWNDITKSYMLKIKEFTVERQLGISANKQVTYD